MATKTTCGTIVPISNRLQYAAIPRSAEWLTCMPMQALGEDGKPTMGLLCLFENRKGDVTVPIVLCWIGPGQDVPSGAVYRGSLMLPDGPAFLYEIPGAEIPEDFLIKLREQQQRAALASAGIQLPGSGRMQ